MKLASLSLFETGSNTNFPKSLTKISLPEVITTPSYFKVPSIVGSGKVTIFIVSILSPSISLYEPKSFIEKV